MFRINDASGQNWALRRENCRTWVLFSVRHVQMRPQWLTSSMASIMTQMLDGNKRRSVCVIMSVIHEGCAVWVSQGFKGLFQCQTHTLSRLNKIRLMSPRPRGTGGSNGATFQSTERLLVSPFLGWIGQTCTHGGSCFSSQYCPTSL